MKFLTFIAAITLMCVLQITAGALVPLSEYTVKSLWTESYPIGNWKEADKFCRSEGKNLATLDAEDQIALMNVKPGGTKTYWVGARSGGGHASFPDDCPLYDFGTGTILKGDCLSNQGVLCVCLYCSNSK